MTDAVKPKARTSAKTTKPTTTEEVILSTAAEATPAVSVAPEVLPPGFYRTASGILAWGG